ncbi:hypothetical protein [Nocardia asiatica]
MSMDDGGGYSLDAAIEGADLMIAAAESWDKLAAKRTASVEELREAGSACALLLEHYGKLLKDAAD